jgi:hypothetical protein
VLGERVVVRNGAYQRAGVGEGKGNGLGCGVARHQKDAEDEGNAEGNEREPDRVARLATTVEIVHQVGWYHPT